MKYFCRVPSIYVTCHSHLTAVKFNRFDSLIEGNETSQGPFKYYVTPSTYKLHSATLQCSWSVNGQNVDFQKFPPFVGG